MSRAAAGRRGFTLIEVMLAVAILSIILAALYSTFFLAHRAIAGLDESLLQMHELRMALGVMEREVEAVLKNDSYPFVVRDRDIFGKQASELSFTTHLSSRPGLARVSYYVEEDGDGGLVLLKELSSAYDEEAEGREAPLIEGIEDFTVEVRDGTRWLRTWSRPGMPQELVVSITVMMGDRPFTMTHTLQPKIGGKV